MNILTFTGLFPNNVFPNQGVFIKERIHALSKLDGVSIKVVAPVPYCPPFIGGRWASYRRIAKAEIIDGLDVTHPRYLMTPKVGMSSYGVLLCLSVLPHIKRLQKRFNFDVIDAHFLYPDGFAAVLLGRLLGKPVVVSVRGSDVNVYKKMRVIHSLLKYTLRRADRIVAVSRALQESIMDFGISREQVTVLPNGVDSRKFTIQSRHEARRSLGLSSDRIILAVGHLTRNKGFDLLLHAFKKVVADRAENDLALIIIGEGVLREELQQLTVSLGLLGKVKLVGAISHQQLGVWYNSADLFCLASEHEGWPNVIMESIACGTPVVATQAGGIPEIINASHLGVLADRTPDAIAHAIKAALDRSWDREMLAREAGRHTWGQVVSVLAQLYRSLLVDFTIKAQPHPVTHSPGGPH